MFSAQRWILVLIVVAACHLAGIVGAMAGIRAAFTDYFRDGTLAGWNYAYAIRWGGIAGLLGAFVGAGVLLPARRERLWWIAILVVVFTLLMSCAGMWWDTATSIEQHIGRGVAIAPGVQVCGGT
jgi:hypothetical protein